MVLEVLPLAKCTFRDVALNLFFCLNLEISDIYMETYENALCLSDRERPISYKELIQERNEEQQLQQYSLSSPQMPELQPAVQIPTQGQMTSDEPPLLVEASLQPSSDDVHCPILTQEDLIPALATENYLQQHFTAFYQTDFLGQEVANQHLNWEAKQHLEADQHLNRETNNDEEEGEGEEEELIEICTSDLLLQNPMRKKRPRLLPPDTKMYVVLRKDMVIWPMENAASSFDPLEYRSPMRDLPSVNLKLAVKGSRVNTSPSKRLPPKKRYTRAFHLSLKKWCTHF